MKKPTFYEIINLTEQVHNASIIQYTEKFETPIGISLIIVLSEIHKKEKCQPIDLVKRLGYSKSSISTITGKLLNKGYIDQSTDPHDRRKIYLKATKEGLAILRKAEEYGNQYYETVYGVLTDEELNQYFHIQTKLLSQLKTDFP